MKCYEIALNDPRIFRINLSPGLNNTKLCLSQGLWNSTTCGTELANHIRQPNKQCYATLTELT